MTDHDEILDRVIDTLREPVRIDADLDRRVLAEIATSPREQPRSWLARRWTIRVSPLGAMAAAAAVAAIALAASLLTRESMSSGPPPAVVSEAAAEPAVTQFVLVAPRAKAVSLVGDFNDWDAGATRLVRQSGDGVWWVTVTLPPGRYRYAFIVDGTIWQPDPAAPAADDEYGRPNSVVTIGGA